jgi:hypothetical protein
VANKHVNNPCTLSNTEVPTEEEIIYWNDPVTGTTRVFCPRCANYVSVNKVNKTFRKHNASVNIVTPDQTQFVQSFE